MQRDDQQHAPIDLGAASEQTFGALGVPSDFVRDIPKTAGISDD